MSTHFQREQNSVQKALQALPGKQGQRSSATISSVYSVSAFCCVLYLQSLYISRQEVSLPRNSSQGWTPVRYLPVWGHRRMSEGNDDSNDRWDNCAQGLVVQLSTCTLFMYTHIFLLAECPEKCTVATGNAVCTMYNVAVQATKSLKYCCLSSSAAISYPCLLTGIGNDDW